MGAREVLLAAALMAMVNRSMSRVCFPCGQEVFENGTIINYLAELNGKYYCPTLTCSYGFTKSYWSCGCCDDCLKGPGESCGGSYYISGYRGQCSSGLECQVPESDDGWNLPGSQPGSCVNTTNQAAKECQSPWFLLNNQCLRVVSGEAEQRSSASANAYCGNLTTGADLAQPKNLTALSDHLQENIVSDTYWLGVPGSGQFDLGPDDSSDVEDCTEFWPRNGLGYGVHHLNDWSCKRNLSFICERHYHQD